MFTLQITRKVNDGKHVDTKQVNTITELLFAVSTNLADLDVLSLEIKK